MTNQTLLLPTEYVLEYYDDYNDTVLNNSSKGIVFHYSHDIISILVLFICTSGLVGNGIVIWLLGFHIKKNPFTTYILNLAVADFGVLISIFSFCTSELFPYSFFPFLQIMQVIYQFMHCSDHLLLTAISIERCVSALFPMWHRCHRPTYLSTFVCSQIWCFSIFPCVICITFQIMESQQQALSAFLYHLIVIVVLCLPLLTLSTLILLFKFCCKAQQPHRGKLLTVILLTLIFFLIFAFPINAFVFFIHYFSNYEYFYLIEYGFLCASLNSGINPVIYFLVGRKKKSQTRESMKVMLQRVFKEEEGKEELELADKT
ncbi:proto-oncogene Mas-like [Eublepharis macularius]|uniref:Proto-oncogene Mas-like n=1 Tax=Eublepharis macularius TaxID=481883 RepID=A0AA97L465_EUBMA|nr:proto-oncogene Mas-like [Eublepharis macularius]